MAVLMPGLGATVEVNDDRTERGGIDVFFQSSFIIPILPPKKEAMLEVVPDAYQFLFRMKNLVQGILIIKIQ